MYIGLISTNRADYLDYLFYIFAISNSVMEQSSVIKNSEINALEFANSTANTGYTVQAHLSLNLLR